MRAVLSACPPAALVNISATVARTGSLHAASAARSLSSNTVSLPLQAAHSAMRLLGRRSALAVLLGALLMLGYCSVAVHGTKEATPAPATATPTAAPVPTTAEASEEAADPPKLGLKEKLMAAYEKILNFDVHAQMDKAEAALIVLKETDYQAMFETAKTAIVEGDIREVEPGLLLSYVALVLMAVVPIIVGSYQSLEDSGDEPAEVMTSADAAYFPVQASITLLSLYLLFQVSTCTRRRFTVRLDGICLHNPSRAPHQLSFDRWGAFTPAAVWEGVRKPLAFRLLFPPRRGCCHHDIAVS